MIVEDIGVEGDLIYGALRQFQWADHERQIAHGAGDDGLRLSVAGLISIYHTSGCDDGEISRRSHAPNVKGRVAVGRVATRRGAEGLPRSIHKPRDERIKGRGEQDAVRQSKARRVLDAGKRLDHKFRADFYNRAGR